MYRSFNFQTLSSGIGQGATEANIFIHGYSAGHSFEDRQSLLAKIPESIGHYANIFAFWDSSHYCHFDKRSLKMISASSRLHWSATPAFIFSDRATHFWRIRLRAEEMGTVLLKQLSEYLRRHYPAIKTVNLIGHSLGGRVVVNCLKSLTKRKHLEVNDVLLLAAAIEVRPDEARRMRDQIRGRLINAYSTDDWTLLMQLDESCIGRNEIEYFENFRMSNFGHTHYWERLSEVFAQTRFKTVTPSQPEHAPEIDGGTAIQTMPSGQIANEHSMTFELSTPNDIYQRINDELARIIDTLSTASDDNTLNEAQKEAHTFLTQYQEQLQKQLAELEKNAEWERFTIAFYGETGAGKSTLIETLRILLQEPSKVASQQKFRELKSQYDLSEENLQRLQQTIVQADAHLSELAQQLSATLRRYEQPQREALAAIEQADIHFSKQKQQLSAALRQHEQSHNDTLGTVAKLQALITERKKTASLWQKILNLFRKMPEEMELAQATVMLSEAVTARNNTAASLLAEQQQAEQERFGLQRQLTEIATQRDNASALLIEQQAEAEHNQHILSQQLQEAEKQRTQLLEDLQKHADGEIIGDGRADFTRQTQHYNFELAGQPFTLLDVPGIEGKEGLVLSEIERAVQTAHAVFYVTNQAAPPQTGEGEEQRKGTLEKIKEHLGSQTEVWTIFNKKITNPKHSLTDRPLTSNDENASLAGLDEKMREQLGAHYREVFPLTALPAFLASTDHFSPDSQHTKRRDKMLADFSAPDLLEKSRLQSFVQLLGSKLLTDAKAKITRANFNKAKEALDQTSRILNGEQRKLAELSERLDQDGDSAKSQLNSSFLALKQRMATEGETLIDNFASNVRNKVYALIEDDISSDYFKDSLRSKIDAEQTHLSGQLPKVLGKEVERFQKDAEDIIKRFESQAKELTAIYSKLGNTKLNDKFDFKIKIDNGIKVAGLVGGLIGLAMAPFTGGASLWLVGASALTVLVSFAKALWGAFSTDYKKSQQRKSTDENLRNVTEQLRDSLRDGLDDALPKMQQIISQIEQAIEAPAKQAATQVQALAQSGNQLQALSHQIHNAGKR
ncbi:DUF726 domain-containing protein [Pseudomonas stutzeri]|uniref:DUF726 domain-containing protein n=1 Tax=Stutzerimonas stutzeri TaxID=316 RepID=A0A2N8RYK4_STUST|nr:DUF726 domain-containing protein [Stutzerimonas stutzeri]MCQ4295954.1 DUF726 domain-containing protein [Stutzerimonas stutzeri]PNF79445.1 DUF726 domain-containing protein [Stutzerimonas stutzeri]